MVTKRHVNTLLLLQHQRADRETRRRILRLSESWISDRLAGLHGPVRDDAATLLAARVQAQQGIAKLIREQAAAAAPQHAIARIFNVSYETVFAFAVLEPLTRSARTKRLEQLVWENWDPDTDLPRLG